MYRPLRCGLALVLLVGLTGCANKRSTEPSSKPRGWKAYDGTRKTDVAALPQAPNATVYTSAGEPVELASMWADSRALVVFYRGHW